MDESTPQNEEGGPVNRARFNHGLFVSALIVCVLSMFCQQAAFSQTSSVTRGETLRIAESFVNHHWQATAKNLLHGKDSSGVEVHTPDSAGARAQPAEAGWKVGVENVGVPYKWGGFDTPSKFDAGIRAGKAAGDVYTAEKRRLGGAAVSGDAVGIDCSGFISRCWKLPRKHSTSMLFAISRKLASPAELEPGDIMNTSEGHVLLFAEWTNPEKSKAIFYESAPFSKTLASEHDVSSMAASGYQPLRYLKIRD